MIKNIVFDMGNVLILFHPETILKRHLDNEDDVNAILDIFYKSGEYLECDKGTKTYSEAIESVADKLPEHLVALLKKLYLDQCFCKEEMPAFPEMYPVVKQLKDNGYKLYLLSNAAQDFGYYSQFIPAMELMDGKIVSSDYNVLKPDREIYDILFSKFSLEPAECVFIDDMQANIDGAAACGMDGICFSPFFESVNVLRDKLRAKGVKI